MEIVDNLNNDISKLKPLHLGVSVDENAIGGLNRFARELVRAQRDSGIDATLLGESNNGLKFQYAHDIGHSDQSKLSKSIRRARKIRELSKDYDVLDVHFAYSSWPFSERRIPKLCHFQGPWYLESKEMNESALKVGLKERIERAVLQDFKMMICLSKAFADILVTKFDIPASNIEVIPPGIKRVGSKISREEIENFRLKFGLETDDKLVICVRRLVPRMGIEKLIEALSMMRSVPRVLIIGGGILKDALERQIKDSGLSERVTLTGVLSERDLQTAYSVASLSVLPSLKLEGFGLSALESMAYGVPVIATRIDGLSELMNGLPFEFLVKPGSAMELSKSISGILNSEHDYKSIFLEHSTKYDWKDVVKLTNECYETVIK